MTEYQTIPADGLHGADPTGWQDMSTAPLDGSWVEILSEEAGTRNPVSYRQWRSWQRGSLNPTFEDHWVDEIGQIRRSLKPIGWRYRTPTDGAK